MGKALELIGFEGIQKNATRILHKPSEHQVNKDACGYWLPLILLILLFPSWQLTSFFHIIKSFLT